MRHIRGNPDEFSRFKDQLFISNSKLQDAGHAVAELLAIVIVQRHDAAFLHVNESEGGLLTGKESARKEVSDLLDGNFVKFIVIHVLNILLSYARALGCENIAMIIDQDTFGLLGQFNLEIFGRVTYDRRFPKSKHSTAIYLKIDRDRHHEIG